MKCFFALLSGIFIGLSGCAPSNSSQSAKDRFPGCSHYRTQADAQHAWEANGKPSFADRDHDKRVCESYYHSTQTHLCRRKKHPVVVVIDRRAYPFTAAHIRVAIQNGKETILHIDRAGATENRKQSLRGIPTKHGFDRDEYPPAMSREGGTDAHVRYVPSADNRGAGRIMGSQLRPYCNGQSFRLLTSIHN